MQSFSLVSAQYRLNKAWKLISMWLIVHWSSVECKKSRCDDMNSFFYGPKSKHFECVHHCWFDGLTMSNRWHWRRQCIFWYQFMFYITWQEWHTYRCVYYTVYVVCSDVTIWKNSSWIVCDDSFNRSRSFLPFTYVCMFSVHRVLCLYSLSLLVQLRNDHLCGYDISRVIS